MDNTQTGSATVAIEKARTAAMFKRPTKVSEHAVAGGGAGLRAPRAPRVIPVEGGIPLIIDDKIVGAVGVSGDGSDHDGICGKAAADVLT